MPFHDLFQTEEERIKTAENSTHANYEIFHSRTLFRPIWADCPLFSKPSC